MRELHEDFRVLLGEARNTESLASRNTRTILCVLAVLVIALLVSTGLCYYFQWDDRRRWKLNVPHRYSYDELSLATKGFSPQQALGPGSFFKGFLTGNQAEVAVKRAAHDLKQGEQQFLAEVHVVGRIRHRNLVSLRGWCHENGELLLVYDYLPGSSLDRLLFSKELGSQHVVVSWENRMKAVTGVAAGVAFLHYECEQRIVHRGIKASNVMLDAMFNAKLGDFCLARYPNQSEITLGYLAPELLRSGKATVQSDVYSFGVFLLEVACGRGPIVPNAPEEQVLLVDWAWKLLARAKLLEAADPRLLGQFDGEEMGRVLSLALLCCHPDPVSRPSMRNVMRILSGDMPLPTLPKSKPEPALRDQSAVPKADSGYDQVIDNRDLRETPSSTSSTKYTRMRPLDVA